MEFPTIEKEIKTEKSGIDSLEKDLSLVMEAAEAEKKAKEDLENEKKLEMAKEGADMVEGNEKLNVRSWRSGVFGAGLDEIEQVQADKIVALREQIRSNTEKIARIKSMVQGLTEDGVDTTEFEKRIALSEDELEKRIMQLTAYELGETEIKDTHKKLLADQGRIVYKNVEFAAEAVAGAHEITGEVVADKKDLPERIKAELKRRDQEKEQAEKDEKDRKLLVEYDQLLEKVKAEFLKLKMDLDHEKSEWESDYDAPELDQQVKELKDSLEKNLNGGFFASFKKQERRKKAQESLQELKALDNNYSKATTEIYNRWLNFNNKTVERVRLENDDLNLTLIGEHMLFNRDKDSEIGIKMARIRKETDELISEIKMGREKYDLHYDENRILSKKEEEAYEARIAALT